METAFLPISSLESLPCLFASSLCVHVAFVRFTLLHFWVMEDWIAGEVNKNKQRIFGGIREDTGNDERNIRSTNGKMKL